MDISTDIYSIFLPNLYFFLVLLYHPYYRNSIDMILICIQFPSHHLTVDQ